MGFVIKTDTLPIYEDDSGSLRVGKSRVLLEIVIRAFQDGASPETIVQRYPTITLADVYSVVGYYLRHRKEIDEYLARREELAQQVRKRIELFSYDEMTEKMMGNPAVRAEYDDLKPEFVLLDELLKARHQAGLIS